MSASSPVRWGLLDIHFVSWNASGYPQLHRLTVGHLLTFFLASLLRCFLAYLLAFCLPFFLTYLLDILSQHWAQMVTVEVRQGTLDMAARCGGQGGEGPSPDRWGRIYTITSPTKAQVYPYKNWSWTCTPTHTPPSQQQTQLYWNIMKYYCILLKQVQIECPYDNLEPNQVSYGWPL